MIWTLILASLLLQAPATAPVQPDQPWPPAGVSRPGGDVVAPRLIKETKPRYTTEARRAKVQGVVIMEVVVREDGTVGDARVTRSLDKVYGLDEEAVKAVKRWRFEAGKKDGKPVPVLVEIEMSFSIAK